MPKTLLRWHNHQLGEVGPACSFRMWRIPATSLRIGDWVIREATAGRCAAGATRAGPARVSVNVSYRQFLSGAHGGTVQRAPVRPAGDALELEMTERVCSSRTCPDTLATLAQPRGLGVTLTIDDFGEGYSALGYLRRLPIDGVRSATPSCRAYQAIPPMPAVCEAIVVHRAQPRPGGHGGRGGAPGPARFPVALGATQGFL